MTSEAVTNAVAIVLDDVSHHGAVDAVQALGVECSRLSGDVARLLEDARTKDEAIKALADALDVVRPPERPAGCWCHHARDVKQAGHSAACVAARDAIAQDPQRIP